MFLSEVFEHLTYGELSQLDIGGLEEGAIQPANYPRVISFINLGMSDLYKEFALKENELNIQMYAHITDYILHTDYALSNDLSAEPYKYIIDSAIKPFQGDVLKVDAVYNEIGEEIPLNDLSDMASVFTSAYDTLQIPFPNENNALSVIYRAGPVKIDADGIDPPTFNVAIPDQLLEALAAYVGYRAHLALPKGDAANAAGSFSRYKAIIAELKTLGTLYKNALQNQKLDNKGWA